MRVISNSSKIFTIGLLTAALAACGGGGGSSGSSANGSGSSNNSGTGGSSTSGSGSGSSSGSSSSGGDSSSSGNSSSTGSSGSSNSSGSSSSGSGSSSSNSSSSSSGSSSSGGSSATTTNHALFVSFFSSTTCSSICDTIDTYSINNSTGALQLVATSDPSTAPYEMDVMPSGKFAYAPSQNVIYQYSYNSTNETLTPLAVPSIATAANNVQIVFDKSGSYAIVSTNGSSGADNTLVTYSIDPTTGALGMDHTVLTQDMVADIVVNPISGIIYTISSPLTSSGSGTANINAYSLNTTTGVLTQISSTPVSAYAEFLTIDPTGQYLYVPTNNDAIAEYTIGTNGTPTPMSAAVISQPSYVGGRNIIIDNTGRYAYQAVSTTAGGSAIAQYTIGTNGVLTPMSVASVPVSESFPWSTMKVVGNYVYGVGQTSVFGYSIGTTGALSPVNTTVYAASSAHPQALTTY